MEKKTVLIPAANDGYTLDLCLASVLPHFETVLVFDDCSLDGTYTVLKHWQGLYPQKLFWCRNSGPQAGWGHARQQLLDMLGPDDRHIFFIDADDVFCEGEIDTICDLVSGKLPGLYLGLAELWGDFNHTTQRLHHHDRCHFYIDRAACPDLSWTMLGSQAKARLPGVRMKATRTPLFFHIKGVKPDWRLSIRAHIRSFWRGEKSRPPTVAEFLNIAPGKDGVRMHEIAMQFLLTSRQDRITPTYLGDDYPHPRKNLNPPKRPEVILMAPETFRMVYAEGRDITGEYEKPIGRRTLRLTP